jgi:hypothetical protein
MAARASAHSVERQHEIMHSMIAEVSTLPRSLIVYVTRGRQRADPAIQVSPITSVAGR